VSSRHGASNDIDPIAIERARYYDDPFFEGKFDPA
jgi:hypothetical protein